MNAPGTTIPLDQAGAGMTLAADLLDAGGTILVAGGARLTETMLAALRRRGIAQLCVEAPRDALEDAAALAAARERACARLAHLYRHGAGEGAGAELLARLLRYRQGVAP